MVRHLQDHQIRELQREPLSVGQAGVQLELERKCRPAVRRLPLQQVHLAEATWVRWLICEFRAPLCDNRGQVVAVFDGLLGVSSRPNADFVGALSQLVVDRLLSLGRAKEHDLATGLQDGVELTDSGQELLPDANRPRRRRCLHVVRQDQVGPGPGQLAKDAHGFDRWALVRDRGPDIKPVHGRSLLVSIWLQRLEQRHLADQADAEHGEVIGPGLGGRHHHDFLLGIQAQQPQHIGRGHPGLPNASERLNDAALGAVLHVVGDVELDRRWIRQVQVAPDQHQEEPEVRGQRFRKVDPSRRHSCDTFTQASLTSGVAGSSGMKRPSASRARSVSSSACRAWSFSSASLRRRSAALRYGFMMRRPPPELVLQAPGWGHRRRRGPGDSPPPGIGPKPRGLGHRLR